MSNAVFRLAYCSRNTIVTNHASEITKILTASRTNNARDGVSGALLYSHGCFAQVLEGDLSIVQRTFERIQRDPRHGDVIVLEARRVDTRIFGMWDMAMAEPADPDKARTALARVLAEPEGDAGTTLVALLDGIMRRESDWASAA